MPLDRRERIERAVGRFIGAAPEFVRRIIIGGPGLRVDGTTHDSRITAIMTLGRRRGRGFRSDLPVGALRAGYIQANRVFGLGERPDVSSRDVTIPVDDGTIAARLYRPRADDGALPLLVYFHGGGFVIGDVPSYDHACAFFAAEGRIAVLSVEYRLGPEYRFPRAHEDAFAAFAWAQQNAGDLGADPARIAVGGDSAGGNLAAAIGALATERGLTAPAYAFLIYPAVDGTTTGGSRTRFTAEMPLPLTTATIAWFSERYANGPADYTTPLLSPLRAPSLAHSPPTYLFAAGFDPLVDEGRRYAEQLRAAGVPVVYDYHPTLSHGALNFAGIVPDAKRALRRAIRAVAAALRSPA